MKRCPKCGREYDNTMMFCLDDGAELLYGPASDSEAATAILSVPVSLKRRPRVFAASAILLGVGLVGAILFAWKPWTSSEIPAVLRAEPLTTSQGPELYPSLSPDGDRVVFTWKAPKQEDTDIYVQQIGAGVPLQITIGPGNDYNPVWSPDGRSIAFLRGDPARPLGRSDRDIRLIAPLGGPERKLTSVSVQEITERPVYLSWCADSKCLIVTDSAGDGRPDALFAVSIDSGEKRQITHPDPPVVGDTNPSLSPDGRSLLFLRRTTWARGAVNILPVNAQLTPVGEARAIDVSPLQPDSAAWTPGSNEVLFATAPISGSSGLWRVPAAGGKATREPFIGEDAQMPTVSPAGPGAAARLVYVRSFTDENIWRLDLPAVGRPATSAPAASILSTKGDIHPRISPDGQRVAFTSTRSGAWEIWVSDLDGSNAVQLTSLKAPTGTGAPSWSPDGGTIAFGSDADGQFDVFTIPSGGGKPRNITSNAALDHVPSYSKDGQWIYFSSTRSGTAEVWKVPAQGGDAQPVSRDGGWIANPSPDGTFLYHTRTAAVGVPTELWRMPAAGGPSEKVVDGALNTSFEVLGRGIYYLGPPAGGAELRFFDLAARSSSVVARNLGDFVELGGFGVSPDGLTVLYARRDSAVVDLMLVENFR